MQIQNSCSLQPWPVCYNTVLASIWNSACSLQLVSRRSEKKVKKDECRSKTAVACSHGHCVIPQSQFLFGILPVACSWTHGGQKKVLKMMNVDPKQLQLVAIARAFITVLVSFWNSACSLQLNSQRSEKSVENNECRSKIAVACSHGQCFLPHSQLQFEILPVAFS